MRIIGIDPGNRETAYCFIEDGKPTIFRKLTNLFMLEQIYFGWQFEYVAVIEQISGMGMAVGKDVFETVWWSGRFCEAIEIMKRPVHRVPRRDVKLYLCGSARAKDSNIITAIVDRYDPERIYGKYGKGVKKNPGPLFGMSKDVWQAFAVGLTWIGQNIDIQEESALQQPGLSMLGLR